MPIRTYSAGMQTRLSFAICTSVDPDVLLLDEGILAGDAAFMERAQARLAAFVARAGILVRPFAHAPRWLRFGLPGDAAAWRRLEAALVPAG